MNRWLQRSPFIMQHSSSRNWLSINATHAALTAPFSFSPRPVLQAVGAPLAWPETRLFCPLRSYLCSTVLQQPLPCTYVCFSGSFVFFFFLFSSDFFFSCDIHSPTGGFRIFLQLIQSFYFEMQLSLRKCISPISRVLTLFYKIIVFFLFIYFLLKRCAYLKAEPTLKDKEKLCIQAQGTVFCLSAR